MRWRLFRLNWSYGLGELVIVVAGVLIALAVDQWNSDRLARVEEVEIIDRFIADLQVDLEGIARGLERISYKKVRLLRIYSSLESSNERPNDMARFLADVVESTTQGWNQARARRTTFDEVLASGKFGLIRNTAIRVKISDYYDSEATAHNRIEERETGYADLSYRLVPRAAEFELATNLSDDQIARLVDRVFDSSLPDHVVAEMNFSQFLNDQFTEWRSRCLELIEKLESYRNATKQER